MNRSIDLTEGQIYAVTDLHGDWYAYERYRDHFFRLYEAERADRLLFLGDLIHGYDDPEEDYSLHIVWDIMQLQEAYGSDTVMVLLGNHELPHIYGVNLSRGEVSYTPRFEHSLGEFRELVIAFFKSLPFIVRTRGGVLFTHAGPSATTADPGVAQTLLSHSHDMLLNLADRMIDETKVVEMIGRMFGLTAEQYDGMVWQQLAVESRDDPRYFDLLRGLIVSNLAEWPALWDFFFSRNEQGLTPRAYERVLGRFLDAYSAPGFQANVLVSGHIGVQEGVEVISGYQLRLGSWTHAQPREEGKYLLVDAAMRVQRAADLLPHVHPMP
ncbi:MAG: hypothetical protein GYB64_15820 [Chloroflexi bacterium]|nr:hypothetical protein [Chloroflexota bacterium]